MKNSREKKAIANIDLTKADDTTLLLEIRNGNNLAHNEIYCRYFKFLKTEAYYLLKDIDSAENVVQDVFMGILLKPRTKKTIPLKHHLFNETTRLCRSIRKNKIVTSRILSPWQYHMSPPTLIKNCVRKSKKPLR
jgi:DNA-directed RNA polymerase specialized sigma24 family protein